MIKVVIIDDEHKGRVALQEKLRLHCPDVEIVGQADNGVDALFVIDTLHPDVVFLDIEMPKMNGFEMLNQLTEKPFSVIFTTAFDQYAIQAIRYSALDYLLKPVDVQELKTAVGRIGFSNITQMKSQVSALQENLASPLKLPYRLAIPTSAGLLFLDIRKIVHLEASSNYTVIHMLDKSKIVASRTLKDFCDLLPGEIFIRVHHSHIINLQFVKRYLKGDGGQVELGYGILVEVSRKYKEEFLRAMGR